MSAPPPQPTATPLGVPVPEQQLFCRVCGSMPAAQATFRRVQGIVILIRFGSYEGPFCRTCGITMHRKVTTDSLWQGWWALWSLLANPVVMLINLVPRYRISRLQPPVPGAPGLPLDPGKPMYKRPAILGFLIPLVVLPLIIWGVTRDAEYADAGDCLHNSGTFTHPDMSIVDCSGSDADYLVLDRFEGTTDESRCDYYRNTSLVYIMERGSTRHLLCLTKTN